jgi:hypothetical protein
MNERNVISLSFIFHPSSFIPHPLSLILTPYPSFFIIFSPVPG